MDIESVKVDIESGEVDIESTKVDIERVLMPFAKLPKTNRRTDILPNSVAVFIMILHYKSVTKYRRTRHTFTRSNGLYAMS